MKRFLLMLSLLISNIGFSQTFWQQTDASLTGDIYSLAAHPNGDIFAGKYFGGIYRSTDKGLSWNQSGLQGADVRSLVINMGTVFAGTMGGGVYSSPDFGISWTQINSGLTNPNIIALAINTSGYIFAGSYSGGVFRSTDNGTSWAPVGLSQAITAALAINSSGEIFVGQVLGNGISRSTDNGDNWVQINAGLPDHNINTLCINSDGYIFAGSSGFGIFCSTDNGDTWVQKGLADKIVYSIVVNSSGQLFAATYQSGVFRSADNGETWTPVNDGLTNNTVLSLVANSGGYIFAGTKGNGVFKTTNSTNSVSITSPLGGEIWGAGTEQSITWTSFSVEKVNIEFSSDGGNSWTSVANNISASSGKYNWLVSDLESSSCKIRISDAANPAHYSISPNPFTINPASVTPIVLMLVVKDNAGGSQELVFGLSPVATDYLDEQIGETEAPPLGPTGSFDARFIGSDISIPIDLGSYTDFRQGSAATSATKLHEIMFQPKSGATTVTITWNLPPNISAHIRDLATGTTINKIMRGSDSLIISNVAPNTLIMEVFYGFTPQYRSLAKGWNMVSVPYVVADMSPSNLFPDAISQVFGFSSAYDPVTNLVNGAGYWVEYPDTALITFRGSSTGNSKVPIKAGWNMIGVYESPTSVNDIIFPVEGQLMTPFYGYKDGYHRSQTLLPGEGYWIKASVDGDIHLQGGIYKKQYTATVEPSNNWGRITLTDAAQKTATLYAISAGQGAVQSIASFELPPTPPAGMFDVRYSSQSQAELVSLNTKDILLQGVTYPMNITVQGIDLLVRDKATHGKIFSQELTANKTAVLNNPKINQLEILTNAKPMHYTLMQNYPNPFNPATIIRYALPEKGIATLKVYDALGSEVATLVNEEKPAGSYTVEFTRTNIPSGVYFYRLNAGNYSDVKKMILLK